MSQVNITLNTNTVDINTTNNQIVVTDPTNPTTVNITQPVTSVVEVITAGPQGPQGPQGEGANIDTGSFATTGSNQFNGNQTITGSLSQGIRNSAIGSSSHAEGSGSIARGIASHAEGYFTNASGSYSHTEGGTTFALGSYSHAEGVSTRAIGNYSHAEGEIAYALGIGSHAEGGYTIASGSYSHAEGYYTSASGDFSHAEGSGSITSGIGSHAEGRLTISSGNYSHAEGESTQAQGIFSHAEGSFTSASGDYSHAEGNITKAIGDYSHAEGDFTQAVGNYSHTEGQEAVALGDYSHAEGNSTQAIGDRSHAEGTATFTGITSAFATEKTDGILNGLVTLDSEYGDISSYFTQNGYLYIHYYDEVTDTLEWASYLITSIDWDGTNTTIQLSDGSINANQAYVGDITYLTNNGVFGGDSTIPGPSAHAEGDTTRAIGPYSHAEGQTAYALGIGSHAEGKSTYAVGNWSHAEGVGTRAIGNNSHAEGEYTQATGNSSHAVGLYTIAAGRRQHVQGMYNIPSGYEGAFIVGNGSAENNRSNLIFAAGNSVEITGSLTVSGSNTFTNIGPAVFSGSINVTQGISGSFSGSGANLNSIPASAITGLSTTQIATGSVTASVSTGTGSFQITSGSTSLMFISSSGNVGIGTNAPAAKLTIQQSNQVYAPLTQVDFDIALGIAANTSLISGLDFKNFNSAGQVRFMARNSQDDYIAINSYGSSASGTLFGLNRGNINAVFGQGNADPSKKLAIGTFNLGDLILGTNNAERMRIFSTGNTAIGTTTDSAKLAVRGSGATTSTTALRVENTNASASLVVLDNGFVGINTGSAQYNLDVNGTARVSNNLTILPSAGGTWTFGPGGGSSAVRYVDGVYTRMNYGTALGEWSFGGGLQANTQFNLGNNVSFSVGNTNQSQVLGFTITRAFSGNVNSVGSNRTVLNLTNTFINPITNAALLRMLYINPDTTNWTTVNSIETVAGNVLLGTTSGSVGIGANTSINASAIVDITSTTQGFLPPRMTTGQRDAIATPATGLMVYDSSSLAPSIYNGVNWQNVLIPNSSGSVGIGTSSPNSLLHLSGSATATSSLARGGNITPTLVAAANNDTLVGLDVAPNFTNGAFTGVQNIGLRITTDGAGGGVLGGLLVRTSGGTTLFSVDRQFGIVTIGNQLRCNALQNSTGGNQIFFAGDGRVNINANGSGLGISFHYSQFGTELLRMFTNTGNLLIQNGGTYTDAGFRLDVSGSARITNGLTVTGSLTINPTGSFVLPLSQSATPLTGSAYWSGSLLFVYNGTRYMSASFF